MSEVLTRPPLELAVAETARFSMTFAEFSPLDGWAATIYFAGPVEVSLPGVPSGNGFDFSIADDTFSTTGRYAWEVIAVHALNSERCRLASSRITIAPDLSQAVGLGDQSTHAERMLAIIEEALEDKAAAGLKGYTIAGRSVDNYTLDELTKMHGHFARIVRIETAQRESGIVRRPRKVLARLR